jgi:hypothetical protein
MKFLSALIATVALTVSTTALASNDWTMIGQLKANETKPVKVMIPAGDLTIEVFSDQGGVEFTCQFYDASGNLGLEQHHAVRCVGNVNSLRHSYLTVKITNEQNKPVGYRLTLTKK